METWEEFRKARWTGKIVVVVGGSDTGSACAERLAMAGASVRILDPRFCGEGRETEIAPRSSHVVVGPGCAVLVGTSVRDLPDTFDLVPGSSSPVRSPVWPAPLRFLSFDEPTTHGQFTESITQAERVFYETECAASADSDAKASLLGRIRGRRKRSSSEAVAGGPEAIQAEVSWVEQRGSRKWTVHGTDRAGRATSWVADEVVLAAGTFGSTAILLRSREKGLEVSESLGTRIAVNADHFAWSASDIVSSLPTSSSGFVGSRTMPFNDVVPVAMSSDCGYSRMVYDGEVRMNWYEYQIDEALGVPLRSTPISTTEWRNLPVSIYPTGGCCAAESGDDGVVNSEGRVFYSSTGRGTYNGLRVIDSSVFPAPVPGETHVLKSLVSSHIISSIISSDE